MQFEGQNEKIEEKLQLKVKPVVPMLVIGILPTLRVSPPQNTL